MNGAIRALERVAEHLGLEDAKAQLRLTIREFDATPESVREGWRARQVANVLRGSWTLAKGIAFAEAQLPVQAELSRKHAQGLTRKRRESAFALSGIEEWLETEPQKKSRNAYDVWVKKRNIELDQDQRPIQAGKSLYTRFAVPWPEIVKAVEEHRVPGELEADPAASVKAASGRSVRVPEVEPNSARSLYLDPAFRGQQIRAAREARGWSVRQLAQDTGLDASQLAKIEQGRIRNSSFETWARLAHHFGLSLDALVAEPSPEAKQAK